MSIRDGRWQNVGPYEIIMIEDTEPQWLYNDAGLNAGLDVRSNCPRLYPIDLKHHWSHYQAIRYFPSAGNRMMILKPSQDEQQDENI